MATAKKRGSGATPASAKSGKASLSSAEQRRVKREERSAAFRARQAAAQAGVAAGAHARISEILCAHEGETSGGKRLMKWSDELGARLYDLIVCGLSMRKISELPGTPTLALMLRWLGTKDHPFGKVYAEAKDMMVPYYEEMAVDVATTPMQTEIKVTKDSEEFGQTTEVRMVDNVERSRLASDAYRWALSHLRPRKHGRNADPEAGKPNSQLQALFDSLKAGPAE